MSAPHLEVKHGVAFTSVCLDDVEPLTTFDEADRVGHLTTPIPYDSALVAKNKQPKNASQIITVNVGGRIYATTKGTLHKSEFFAALLNMADQQILNCGRDSDGNLFIDRNGRVFEGVLETLRTGAVVLPPGVSRLQMRHELEFFGVDVTTPDSSAAMLHDATAAWQKVASEVVDAVWVSILQDMTELAFGGYDEMTLSFEAVDSLALVDTVRTTNGELRPAISSDVFGSTPFWMAQNCRTSCCRGRSLKDCVSDHLPPHLRGLDKTIAVYAAGKIGVKADTLPIVNQKRPCRPFFLAKWVATLLRRKHPYDVERTGGTITLKLMPEDGL